jgi:hypothetical protein
LWRAVDQDGVVLDILVQALRDTTAAKCFFKRSLKNLQYLRVIVTEKLRSDVVAQRQLLLAVKHRQSRYLNNRAENSHRPTDTTTRMAGATVQIAPTSQELPPHTPLFTVTFVPAVAELQLLPTAESGPVRSGSGAGDVRPARSMIGATRLPSATGQPHKVNVPVTSDWAHPLRQVARPSPIPGSGRSSDSVNSIYPSRFTVAAVG